MLAKVFGLALLLIVFATASWAQNAPCQCGTICDDEYTTRCDTNDDIPNILINWRCSFADTPCTCADYASRMGGVASYFCSCSNRANDDALHGGDHPYCMEEI